MTQYLPEMKGGAYEGVTIRNVLQMASGVKWDETYTDPKSDRQNCWKRKLALKPLNSVLYDITEKSCSPGSIWNYSTGESFLVGALLERVTGKPLGLIYRRLCGRIGNGKDATWWTESPGGLGLSGSGLGATLRDYARFGSFVLDDGVVDGKRLVPEGWFREAAART